MMRATAVRRSRSAALALAGCGGEQHRRPAAVRQGVGQPAARAAFRRCPRCKPYEPFTYNAFDLDRSVQAAQDRAAARLGRPAASAPDLNRRKEPLEAYPAREPARWSARCSRRRRSSRSSRRPTTASSASSRAIIIGQNFGRITEISESDIKLKEIVQDSGGNWEGRRPARCCCRRKQEGVNEMTDQAHVRRSCAARGSRSSCPRRALAAYAQANASRRSTCRSQSGGQGRRQGDDEGAAGESARRVHHQQSAAHRARLSRTPAARWAAAPRTSPKAICAASTSCRPATARAWC